MMPVIERAKEMETDPALQHAFSTKYPHCHYSFDNPNMHEAAVPQLEALGWDQKLRAPLSPYSPDMHRVIEHLHAVIQAAFQQRLYNHPKKCSVGVYKKCFEAAMRDCCKASSIAADVRGLPELYQWISVNEGRWAPKRLR